nr:hypothetical protein [Fischerella sp. FACHB-380]
MLTTNLEESNSETKSVKYFFLSEGWTIGRVWASEGLWQITAWRRQPDIQRMNICLLEQGEVMWLYRVEDAVITVEVKPITSPQTGISSQAIGQVILRRLMSAEQVIERLETASARCQLQSIESVVQ